MPKNFAATTLTLAVSLASVAPIAAYAQVSSDESGHLEQTHSLWCSSNLEGTTVYNDKGESVATIKDLLFDQHGQIKDVVLSVGSFIGISKKYVEMPFASLVFKSTRPGPEGSQPAKNAVVGNAVDFSATLPGVTKEKLTAMPNFDYNK